METALESIMANFVLFFWSPSVSSTDRNRGLTSNCCSFLQGFSLCEGSRSADFRQTGFSHWQAKATDRTFFSCLLTIQELELWYPLPTESNHPMGSTYQTIYSCFVTPNIALHRMSSFPPQERGPPSR